MIGPFEKERYGVSKVKMFWVRVFGKLFISIDGMVECRMYKYRGVFYIDKIIDHGSS